MVHTTKIFPVWLRVSLFVPIGLIVIYALSDEAFADSGPVKLEDSDEVVAEHWKADHSPAMAAYLDKYGRFQVKAFENLAFKNRSTEEIQALFGEFLEFNVLYLDLTIEERMMVKRPDFPYVKLEKEGKPYYKRLNELNAAERKSIGC